MGEEGALRTWWACLKVVAVFNMLLWALACLFRAESGVLSWQLIMSGIFVAVCAFRSWLPRIDLERYCLVDSPLSSTLLGRSAATVAEMCFATQVALALRELGLVAGVPAIATASHAVVPTLVVAQLFCWYSVLTLDHLGHVCEESLWAATMAMVGVCLTIAAAHLEGRLFWLAAAGTAVAAAFVTFMGLVDVPMYVRRWRRARRERQPCLTLRAGFIDARNRRVKTTEWAVWKPEAAWLTGYFSVAVWISLSIACVSPR